MPLPIQSAPLIFLSAGEASGDHYGAELIASLRNALPEARFTGLGGMAMEIAGQRRVIRAEDVAVMGITEILRHVPRIVVSYRRLVRSMQQDRPDAAVLIDFPDVNFRLAKHLKRMGVPVIWFVSPQLWAWKRGRLRWVQERVDKMLTIFPFEEPFYRARGVDAEFVGHPLAEAALPAVSREAYAEQAHMGSQRYTKRPPGHQILALPEPLAGMHGPNPEMPWIALLPGSRRSEIRANLQTMLDAARLIGPGYEYLVPVAPTIPDEQLVQWNQITKRRDADSGGPRATFVRDARAALLHSRAAVVASGTATVQAAVIGTPFVTVYRVSGFTYRIAKRLVQYPEEMAAEKDVHGNLPVSMVNLIGGRRIVPELLQEQFTAARVAGELKDLLEDTPGRAAQLAALAEVRERLRADPERPSVLRVRDAVLSVLAPNAGRMRA